MAKKKASSLPGQYDPDKLLNFLLKHYSFKTDGELAKFLGVSNPTISRIRYRNISLSPKLFTRIQKLCGLSSKEIRDIMDDRRHILRMTQFPI